MAGQAYPFDGGRAGVLGSGPCEQRGKGFQVHRTVLSTLSLCKTPHFRQTIQRNHLKFIQLSIV